METELILVFLITQIQIRGHGLTATSHGWKLKQREGFAVGRCDNCHVNVYDVGHFFGKEALTLLLYTCTVPKKARFECIMPHCYQVLLTSASRDVRWSSSHR